MKRIKLNYKRLNNAVFLQVITIIALKMDGNTTFAALQQQVADVKPFIDEYERLLALSADGSKRIIAARNEARDEVTKRLRSIGVDVESIAGGDIDKLESSGFLLCKPKRSTQQFEKPAPPRLLAGVNKGEALCRAKKQRGCTSVCYFLSTTPVINDSVEVRASTKSKYLFTGLKAGVTYYIGYKLGWNERQGGTERCTSFYCAVKNAAEAHFIHYSSLSIRSFSITCG